MSSENEELFEPILEVPPDSDAIAPPMLSDEDSVAGLGARLTAAEAFLGLLIKDCTYTDFVREILLTIMRIVKSEAGSIIELDHRNKEMFFRAVVGQSSDLITRYKIPFGKGIAGHVAESKQPVLVGNVAENTRHHKDIDKAVGFDTRNMVAVPIFVRGSVYAILELMNRIGENEFTHADQEVLVSVCEQAARAIEARLMMNWVLKQGRGKKAA